MLTQDNITPDTPMGANLLPTGGATFRVWAPAAHAVYLNGAFSGSAPQEDDPAFLLVKTNGYWTGFLASARDGDLYTFYVVGDGSTGMKRDPYARELATDQKFPGCSCVLRSAVAYPWHDSAFVTPDPADMIIYQVHIGTFNITTPGKIATFLDVIERIPYINELGANVLQPLPVTEVENPESIGYDGADYFSPDIPYVVTDPAILQAHLDTINKLLDARHAKRLAIADITSAPSQLQALVDLCHLYGIAVVFDVVYNHAGDFFGDDHCLYFWDRQVFTSNNDSLYFTDKSRGAGGLTFAYWNNDVRAFVIDNARRLINEFHIDGLRYDQVSDLISMNDENGWTFCRDLTDTVRFLRPRFLQNAEFWPNDSRPYFKTTTDITTSTGNGGAGFDVVQHDALRDAIRNAIDAAHNGQSAFVSMQTIADNLFPPALSHAWQAVTSVENHDIVKVGTHSRLPALADPAHHRSWYARSRSRVATGLLLTAPGMPQLFMGQECLEDKQWNTAPFPEDTVYWDGVLKQLDSAMVNHFRFTQDLIRLRWLHPAFRGDNVNAFYVSDNDRVLAFHRWLDDGRDILVVATLAESNWFNYAIGFPASGHWTEIFNSDVYDNWVNPQVAGNNGGITAGRPPLHGFATSAGITIPANGIVVFARG